jgi:hypothetical protein
MNTALKIQIPQKGEKFLDQLSAYQLMRTLFHYVGPSV